MVEVCAEWPHGVSCSGMGGVGSAIADLHTQREAGEEGERGARRGRC